MAIAHRVHPLFPLKAICLSSVNKILIHIAGVPGIPPQRGVVFTKTTIWQQQPRFVSSSLPVTEDNSQKQP